MLCLVGLSSRVQHTADSQHLDDFVTRRLEEKRRAARVILTLFFFPFKQTSLCLIEIWKDIRFQNHLFCKHLLLQISIKMWLPVFQAKVENAQLQEVSPEPASRLQSLRDRDTVTRFDRAVSILPQLSAMILPI